MTLMGAMPINFYGRNKLVQFNCLSFWIILWTWRDCLSKAMLKKSTSNNLDRTLDVNCACSFLASRKRTTTHYPSICFHVSCARYFPWPTGHNNDTCLKCTAGRQRSCFVHTPILIRIRNLSSTPTDLLRICRGNSLSFLNLLIFDLASVLD